MANENAALIQTATAVNAGIAFDADFQELLALLGQTNVQTLAPGTAWHITTVSGTISDDAVAEKATIPDAGITAAKGDDVVLTYSKYRNLVGIESIGKLGQEAAVNLTTMKLVRHAESAIRSNIVAALAKGTTTATSAATFQPALANVWGKLAEVCVDEAVSPVYFVNPTDAAAYMGTATVGLATAFGLTYIANFLGLGTLIVDPGVESGKIYGTVQNNLNVLTADVRAIQGMDVQADALNALAVHVGPAYDTAAIETVVYCGASVQPSALDHIVIGTIGA